ncbi:MAG: gfo/Idh/MocA family oxidoreductase [Planctomycetes bacterium]|nr:gfo/Idh/MocA family oxidoreductase [Planctomycetota bacterium]
MSNEIVGDNMDRRSFLKSTAAAGAGLMISPSILAAKSRKKGDINVALLGAGAQGKVLMMACLKMGKKSGIRFKAVCDIWDFHRNWASRRLKAYKHPNNTYIDYREMLANEKDLDAVIIATPDFWHAEHAAACMKAGLHVYCEKEMSNTLEGARKIVKAAKETGKLLQVGHQRRSNPRYRYCYDKLIEDANLLNRITTVNGQWNRSKAACEYNSWKPGTEMDAARLKEYGFESMEQFRNWRWYKGLGGGPIVDLGSHQLDIFSWFLNANPKSVIASGGKDYWTGRDWYDSVMTIFEYQTKQGTVRAFYQTITTNSNNGYYETFMGDEGTLVISEASGRGNVYRESWVPEEKWAGWVKKGYIIDKAEEEKADHGDAVVDVRASIPAAQYDLPVTMDKPFHQPHVENFFSAIRGEEKLNCPAEIGYETAVMVLKVNEAIIAGKKLDFKPEDFEI